MREKDSEETTELCQESSEKPVIQITYAPHSPEEFSASRKEFKTYRKIPILNLEFTGACNLNCMYCDSEVGKPSSEELITEEIKNLVLNLKQKGLRQVHICGLGEPSMQKDFFELLELFHANKIMVSFYTNGTVFRDEDIDLLIKYDANMIVKLDSLDMESYGKLIQNASRAKQGYHFIQQLIKRGFVKKRFIKKEEVNGQPVERWETNMGINIVPTRENRDDIAKVVAFCKENFIFPNIGDVEYAGLAADNKEVLMLDKEELEQIRGQIREILGHDYRREPCAAITMGLNVSSTGEVRTDSSTGLSCSHCFQEKVRLKTHGNVKTDSLEGLWSRIMEHKISRLSTLRSNAQFLLRDAIISPGCAGHNTGKLIADYHELIVDVQNVRDSIEVALREDRRNEIFPKTSRSAVANANLF